ncbi:DUF4402 domain-containing protein [Sphingomicrobium clamense]|uniref:DUF4402 domain-containing protein n=1 Tax=Sphingomicrobium clamense TaxID=2851013 RepID=A0ABS6V587_9SPHN|nr:DUF4402 domain-containing protein [Sphingomicrobium sp. B8]MBW0144715.1 DUF4402 domain-containing protein [Sphingomicrobium sp. B8]
MNRLFTLLTALLGAALLAGAPTSAHAQQVTKNAKVKVNIKKPLVITLVQDLEMGNIVLPTGPGSHTVTLAQDGTLTCPAALTCSGVVQPAAYNLTGSHKQSATIQAPDFDLVNAATGDAIRFYPDAPATVQLPNSGNRGVDFNVGGSITIPSTAEGAYEGTITIIADYE